MFLLFAELWNETKYLNEKKFVIQLDITYMEVEMLDVTESSCRLCLVPITNAAVDLYAEQLIEMVESVFRITVS